MTYKMVHVPEDDEPALRGGAHNCAPGGTISRHRSEIKVKHRSIAECQDCGQYWWASVYAKYNNISARTLYHLEWNKLRWYHFELRKYVK